MHAPSDAHLLASWLESSSEAGFRSIVERYAGLVYMTAKRTGADDALAKEASQLTFITLARKAASLSQRDSLGGWLHVTSMMQAKNLLQLRKREALKLERFGSYLQIRPADSSTAWRDLEPVLDEALAALSKSDREAILLRYYRSLSVREVAANLTLSVDAAQKRLDRAMDRLRHQLGRRGVAAGSTLGAVLLAGFASDVQAAAPLASSLASKALKTGPATASPILTAFLLALFTRKAAVVALVLPVLGTLALTLAHRDPASPASPRSPQPSEATTAALSPQAEHRLRLSKKYGKERTLLSQTITDQALQISFNTHTLLTERVVPFIERNRDMPRTAKLDPTLNLTDEQRRKLGTLSAQLMKRLVVSKGQTLERIRDNPLPVMELLLMGDACARGEITLAEFESYRASLGSDLAVLENPVEVLGGHPLQFGTEDPYLDETYMAGLREVMSPSQLETFVRASRNKMAERVNVAMARSKFLTFATLPPIELTLLAKQAGGSLTFLEGVADNLQASAKSR